MSARKKQGEINLIPIDKFAQSYAGKVLSWLLSTFRFVVIVVEMVVMGAFLSRFWLDAKNSDLNDEIKQKQAIIAASKSFEDEFNRTKDKFDIYQSLTQNQRLVSDTLRKIPSYLPEEITLSNISVSETGMSLSGNAPSEVLIAQFIANLKQESTYKEIALTQVETDEDRGDMGFKLFISIL